MQTVKCFFYALYTLTVNTHTSLGRLLHGHCHRGMGTLASGPTTAIILAVAWLAPGRRATWIGNRGGTIVLTRFGASLEVWLAMFEAALAVTIISRTAATRSIAHALTRNRHLLASRSHIQKWSRNAEICKRQQEIKIHTLHLFIY